MERHPCLSAPHVENGGGATVCCAVVDRMVGQGCSKGSHAAVRRGSPRRSSPDEEGGLRFSVLSRARRRDGRGEETKIGCLRESLLASERRLDEAGGVRVLTGSDRVRCALPTSPLSLFTPLRRDPVLASATAGHAVLVRSRHAIHVGVPPRVQALLLGVAGSNSHVLLRVLLDPREELLDVEGYGGAGVALRKDKRCVCWHGYVCWG
ncbi:hypothetical protein BJ546DRAFT_286677 [Cryomyces antarcticus]